MTQFGRPDIDETVGSWTATPLWQKIDEATPSDADFITDSLVGTTCEVGLTNITDPQGNTAHTFSYRHSISDIGGGGEQVIARLIQGPTTIIASQTVSVTTTWTTSSYTLTTTEADSITNYNDLRLRFTGIPELKAIRLSWAEFQVPNAPPVTNSKTYTTDALFKKSNVAKAYGIDIIIDPPLPTAQFARPNNTISAGVWTAVGAPSINEATDETTPNDLTDYAKATFNSTYKVSLSNVTDPQTGIGHVIRFRSRITLGSGIYVKVELRETGGVLRASTGTKLQSTAWTTFTYNLTQAEANSISNTAYAGGLEFWVIGTGLVEEEVQVTWTELEVPFSPRTKIYKIDSLFKKEKIAKTYTIDARLGILGTSTASLKRRNDYPDAYRFLLRGRKLFEGPEESPEKNGWTIIGDSYPFSPDIIWVPSVPEILFAPIFANEDQRIVSRKLNMRNNDFSLRFKTRTVPFNDSRWAIGVVKNPGSFISTGTSGQKPILFYDMETLNGTMKDLSGNGFHGTITGTVDVAGKIGRARQFTAESDRIVITGFNHDGRSAFTHTAWVKIGNAFPTRINQYIIGAHTGSTDSQGTLRLVGPSGGTPTSIAVFINTSGQGFQDISRSVAFVNGNVHHIAVTWDGSNVRIYLDGAQLGDDTPASGTLVNGPLSFVVGAHPNVSTTTFNEFIDEPLIFSRALSDAEIAELYNETFFSSLTLATHAAYVQYIANSETPETRFLRFIVQGDPPARGSGLVLDYDMETKNADGTMNDLSGQGNYGTITGTTDVTGQIGRARDFDGVDDKVEVADSASLDITRMTIAAWVKPDTIAAGRMKILGKNGAYTVGRDGSSLTIATWVASGVQENISSSGQLTVGMETHVAFVYDGANHIIYVNGTAVLTVPRTGNIDATTSVLQVGALSGTEFWDGVLDEVSVYNRALSDTEILNLFEEAPRVSSVIDITSAPSAEYKIELKRGGDIFTLSVFSDDYITHVAGSPVTLDASTLKLESLNYIQAGSNDVGLTGSLTLRLSELDLIINDYMDINEDSASADKIIDKFDLTMNINESKSLDLSLDDSEQNLANLEVGDELLAWFDNHADGLLFSYDMESKNIDDLIDLSGNGRDLTITGNPDTVIAAVERGQRFSGNNNLVGPRTGRLNLTNNLSLSCLFFIDSHDATNGEYIIGSNDDLGTSPFEIFITPGGFIRCGITNTSDVFQLATGVTAINTEVWYHAILVYDSASSLKIYLDGKLEAENNAVSGQIKNSIQRLIIGDYKVTPTVHSLVGVVDDVFALDKAITPIQASKIFELDGRCPKIYFHGYVDNVDRKDNNIDISSSTISNELANLEAFDIIFEGNSLESGKGGTNDLLAHVSDTFDAEFDVGLLKQVIKLKDSSGNSLTSDDNDSIEDIKIRLNETSIPFSTTSGLPFFLSHSVLGAKKICYLGFMATDIKYDKLWIRALYNLMGSASWELTINIIEPNADDQNFIGRPNQEQLTPIMTAIFNRTTHGTSNGSTIWTSFDLTSATWNEDLIVGNKYFIEFKINFVNGYPNSDYFAVETSQSGLKSGHETWQFIENLPPVWNDIEASSSMSLVNSNFFTGGADVSPSGYSIEYSSSLGMLVVKFNDNNFKLTSGRIVPNAFFCSYIYSKGNLKLKHIMERLIRKSSNMKGVYTGRVTTEKLGVYTPRGGSVLSHLNSLAKISDSTMVDRIPGRLFIEDKYRRSTLGNGTMEKNENWSYFTNTTQGENLGYAGFARTGSKAYSVKFNAGAFAVGDTVGLYQDIKNWSGEISVWAKTSVTNSNFKMRLYKEPIGGGTRTFLDLKSLNTSYIRLRGDVTNEEWRLIIVLECTVATGSGPDITMDIDDVSQGVAFYGFEHGYATEIGQEPEQYIYKNVSTFSKEGNLDNVVNLAFSTPKEITTLTKAPIIGAAKNIELYDKYGPRMATRSGETTLKVEDMYKRAKALLSAEFEESVSLKVSSQMAFLFAKPFLVLYPDSGIDNWKVYMAQSVRVSLDDTQIQSSELEILDISQFQRLKEKEDEQTTIEVEPPSAGVVYFAFSDFSSTASSSAGEPSAIVIDAFLSSTTHHKLAEGIHEFIFDRNSFVSLANDKYLKDIVIADSDSLAIGKATLTDGYRFLKFRGMWVILVLFDRRKLLNIS